MRRGAEKGQGLGLVSVTSWASVSPACLMLLWGLVGPFANYSDEDLGEAFQAGSSRPLPGSVKAVWVQAMPLPGWLPAFQLQGPICSLQLLPRAASLS